MLLSTRTLERYAVHAMDGDMGRVCDVYFDDARWTVRHVVVSTGHWLNRQRVLIPLAALRRVDVPRRELHVALGKEQVAQSPDVHSDEPVSRQHEAAVLRYFGFPYYWTGPAMNPAENWEGRGDPHLHSARAVRRYAVREVDGALGRVSDLLVDDERWQVRYAVVEVDSWLPGKSVLIGRSWITGIEWGAEEVRIAVTRATLEHAPAYDRTRPVSREDEQHLREYYARVPGGERTA